jgi:hypothetical protein
MQTLYSILNPSMHKKISMLNADERDKIIEILDTHVLFTQMKIIDMLYIANRLGMSTDVRIMYRELTNHLF